MKNPVIRAKAASAAIAQARQGLSTFTLSELVGLLIKFNCPYAKYVPSHLVSLGIIVKKGKEHVFSSPEPVHFSKLIDVLNSCANLQGSYVKKSRENKTAIKIDQPVVRPEMTLELMIETLKAAGYKVLQPYTAYKPV